MCRTRGDHCAELGAPPKNQAKPTVADLTGANTLLGKVKDTARLHYLRYKTQPAGPKRLIVDADSSFHARIDP